jgi:uncharacterized membrane protein YgcG
VRYIARGVVRRANGADLLEWNALPVDHSYRIDSSTIVIEYPAAAILQGKPSVKSNRVAFAEAGVQQTDRQVQVTTSRIEKDGWVLPSLRFPEGSVISSPPAWQARELRAQAFAPRWATAAVIVFAVGVLVIVIFRRPYEKPPDQWTPTTHGGTLPDTLRPAVAGALSSSGRVGLEHAMATLFGLADRGDLTIVEEPKKWGQRQFNVTRLPGATPRHPEEAVLLDAAFKNKGNDETTVPLVKARTRIAGKLRDFKAAIHRELGELGLLDDERKRARSRYAALGGMLLALAALLIIPAAFLAGEFDGWPFLVVVAAGAAAIVSFIAYGALTPLSNEGWRRAHAWRGYRKYLQNVARGREPLAGDTPQRLLAYAVALNLAAVWSKFVKKHPSVVPPWYQSLAASGADDSFPAFIAYGGAADGGGNGGAGGGGGAAGGGGSGAG